MPDYIFNEELEKFERALKEKSAKAKTSVDLVHAIVDPVVAEKQSAAGVLSGAAPLPSTPPLVLEPEIDQPETAVTAVQQDVREQEQQAVAATRPRHEAIRAQLAGESGVVPKIDPQTPEEAAAIAAGVAAEIRTEKERREGDWWLEDEGILANVANLAGIVTDVSEDASRWFFQNYNKVGPDVNLPGQSEEDQQLMLEIADNVPQLYEEIRSVRVKGLSLREDLFVLDRSPQGNYLGLDENRTHANYYNDYFKKHLDAATERGETVDVRKLRAEAQEYARDAVQAIKATTIGRKLPLLKREQTPGEVAAWLNTYPPAMRVAMTGFWQDSATIVLPNGQSLDQDLTQNTIFGALDYGFNLISPVFKPFAAGAATDKTLTREDMRRYIDESSGLLGEWDPMAIAAKALLPALPEDTGIPFDVSSTESLDLMRVGRADIVSQHGGLGGAAGEALMRPAGEDAGIAERSTKWVAQGLMNSVFGDAATGMTGWTGAEVAGGIITGVGIFGEPDGTWFAGPVGVGASSLKKAVKLKKLAKIEAKVDEIVAGINASGDATEMSTTDLAQQLSSVTGVDTRDIIGSLHGSRLNDLISADEDFQAGAVAAARRQRDAIDDLEAAERARILSSPQQVELRRMEEEEARVIASRATQDSLQMQIGWQREVDRAAKAGAKQADKDLKSAVAAQAKADGALTKLHAKHSNKLKQYKEARTHRDEMGEALDALRASSSEANKEALENMRGLRAELRAAGIKPPTSYKGVAAAMTIHAEKVGLLRRYEAGLKRQRGLKSHYKPLLKSAQGKLDEAEAALKQYAPLDKVLENQARLRRTLLQAAQDAANARNRIRKAHQASKIELLEAGLESARVTERTAYDKSQVLRKKLSREGISLGDDRPLAAPGSPRAAMGTKTTPGPIDAATYERYYRQAMLELLDGVRAHVRGTRKTGDTDLGAADGLVRGATKEISADGERVIDGAAFEEALKGSVPKRVWAELHPPERELIEAGIRGGSFSGSRAAALRRAVNRGVQLAESGNETPVEELSRVFWASVDDINRPLWGGVASTKIRGWWRSANAYFGTAGDTAPHMARVAVTSGRVSRRLQQEIYEVTVDADDPIRALGGFFDSIEGVNTRGGMTAMNQGDETLYDQWLRRVEGWAQGPQSNLDIDDKAFWEAMSDSDADALATADLDLVAVTRAFLPDTEAFTKQQGAFLHHSVMSAILKNPPGDSVALYNRMPHILAAALENLKGTPKEDWLQRINATRNTSANIASFAAGLAQGSVVNGIGDALLRMQLGRHSVEDVAAANKLLTGERKGFDFQAGVRVLNEMEQALNPRGVSRTSGLGDKVLTVIRADEASGAVFAPKALIDDVNRSLDGMVKELDAINTTDNLGPLYGAASALRQTIRAVQIGLVRGYVIPRFKRFANANFQNFTQMYSRVGLTRATAVTLRAVPANFTWAMPQFALDAGVRARNAVTDAVGAPALPSWTKTLVLRDTGRIFAGESGTITLGGSTYTYDEIRKMSAEMGIMEDTLRSELGPDLQKTLKRGRASRRRDAEFVRELRAANPKITDEEIEAAKAARSDFDKYLPGRAIGAMADAWRVNEDWVTRSVELMEQRVRMELFLEGLHMGMNPQQAGRLVDEALYDWSSPMTQLEVMSIARWVPFYRVFRNSGAHAMRMLTEPFTTPDFGDYTRRAMMGQTQMGRTRAMWRFQQFYGWETDADPNRPGRQPRSEMEPGTLLMPRWVSSKTPAKVVGAPMEDQMWFVERKGAVKDQLTIAHPNNAALEAVEMVTSGIMFGTAAAIVAMDNAGHLAGLTGGRTALPADWMARLGDLAANYVGIATPEIIKAATGSGRPVELSDAEATMLRSFGIEPRPTEDGRLTTAPLVKDVMRYIPFVGPQVLDVFKAMYDRPLSDEDGEALVQIMGHVVGLQRKYYSGQSEEYGRRVEDARRAMSTYGMPVKDPRGLDQK